jgi:anti-anti-sigma factor
VATEANNSLHCDVENSPDDQYGNKVTMVKCHGRLVSDTAGELKGVVKPLIPQGDRIVLGFGDVNYLDSSGLGALVGLKATALSQGLCKLEVVNMTLRILELLRITSLTNMFSTT